MLLTKQLLSSLLPLCKNPQLYVEPLNQAISKYNINTVNRLACFLSQIAHESGSLNRMQENLNYSPSRLMQVWPNRFPSLDIANQYGNNPQKIANKVYSNRMGNGDEASNDGYKYRGRGLLQITGKSNYAIIAKYLNLDLLNNPDLLLDPTNAVNSAAHYWNNHDCNNLADKLDHTSITKKINGGVNGLKDRIDLYNHINQVLIKNNIK